MAAIDDLLGRDEAAVDVVAGETRPAVAHHRASGRRPQAVGADERRALVRRPVLAGDENAAVALLEAHEALRRLEGDLIALAARLEDGAVEVAAMHDEIRVCEPCPELRAEVDPRQLVAGDRVGEDQRIGIDDMRRHPLEDTEALEDRVHVRPHLDAVADLAELGGFLQHPHAPPPQRERERHRQAADAATGDKDFGRRCHRLSSYILRTAGSQDTSAGHAISIPTSTKSATRNASVPR